MNSQTETRGDRPILARLFISPDEPRLRAGWRIAAHAALMLMIGIIPVLVGGIAYLLIQGTIDQASLAQLVLAASSLIYGPSILLATWIARRFIDKRSFSSLGFNITSNTVRDFVFGLALPAALIAVIFLLEWGFGWLQVDGFAWHDAEFGEMAKSLILLAVVFIAVGFYEEILFRGYYMQNLKESMGRPLAILLTSVGFGLAHLANANATFMGVLGTAAAGIIFAYAWLRSKALWLPIALHISWNFFEGPVFGFPVSGREEFSLIRVRVEGPELLTGGAFGPEAGLIVVPVLAAAAWIIWLYTKSRNEEAQSEP
jgi:membrane protease YdiL (CAAX protease family)